MGVMCDVVEKMEVSYVKRLNGCRVCEESFATDMPTYVIQIVGLCELEIKSTGEILIIDETGEKDIC